MKKRQEIKPLVYPVLQVRPNLLLAYNRIEYPTQKAKKKRSGMFCATGGAMPYSGFLVSASTKRLKRAITLLVAISKPKTAMNWKLNKEFSFRLNFVTLTLPAAQGTRTDKEIKKRVLDVWIKAARRIFKLGSYVWRAERQKNGNLHFHFVTDTYMQFDTLRDSWNQRLNILGFIDEFEKKHGHRHPNSTDVHAIRKVQDLSAYMTKYMSKKEKHPDKIEGRIWDCSNNLKTKKFCEFHLVDEALQVWETASNNLPEYLKHNDASSSIYLTEYAHTCFVTGTVKEQYNSWLDIIRKPDAN